jgi:hypothetical protein
MLRTAARSRLARTRSRPTWRWLRVAQGDGGQEGHREASFRLMQPGGGGVKRAVSRDTGRLIGEQSRERRERTDEAEAAQDTVDV